MSTLKLPPTSTQAQQQHIMMNCSNPTLDANILTFELILYSLVTFFGIIFNTVAIWVFFFRLKKWTETRVYMINLVIADYTVLFTLPFISYFHYHNWSVDIFCKVVFGIYMINMPMSISIITLIALDRYIAIKHPLKAKSIRSPRKSAIICFLFWLCNLLYISIYFIYQEENICFYKTSDKYNLLILIQSIIFFFIPLAIVLFCSIQVIKCLKKKKNASLQEEKKTKKAICVVSVNLATFIICFVPFYLSLLTEHIMLKVGVRCEVSESIRKIVHSTACLASLNCCLDAICYYLVAKEFQEAAALPLAVNALKSRSNLTYFSSMQSRSNLTQDSHIQS